MTDRCNDDSPALAHLDAGGFSAWLQTAQTSLQPGAVSINVPCGDCRGCCRSSMFVHIQPQEKPTLRRIPRALRFPAPGLPKGHVLMGYNDCGACPMLLNSECSIYEDRPQTCRVYDCRIFAATGIAVDRGTQPEIATRVSQWEFTYESEQSRAQQQTLQQAAQFLETNRDLFPPGFLPNFPVQLAALSIQIYSLFAALTAPADSGAAPIADAEIAQAIVSSVRPAGTEPCGAAVSSRG
jgi:Fe-S-cluster containining protein